MTIKIAHLYYNLNDKSENYNIDALKKFNSLEGIKTEIYLFTLNENINFNDYDIYYIGNIKEEYLKDVENDLKNYTDEIIKSIDNKKHFLLTGSSVALFEKSKLNILDYRTKKVEEEIITIKSNIIKEPIIGISNLIIENNEFYHYKNLYAFTLTGPLLIKNPYLTKHIIKSIIKGKNKYFKWQINNDLTEIKAYKQTMNM